MASTLCEGYKEQSRCNWTASWQSWQIAAANSDAFEFSKVSASIEEVSAPVEGMLAASYFFLGAMSLPLYMLMLLMHPRWQCVVPLCSPCVRCAARRSFAIWALSFSLALFSLLASLPAVLLTKGRVQQPLDAWKEALNGSQPESQVYVSGYMFSRSYTNPGSGRIYVATSAAIVDGASFHLFTSVAVLCAMLLVLCPFFCSGSRRGLALLRELGSVAVSKTDDVSGVMRVAVASWLLTRAFGLCSTLS